MRITQLDRPEILQVHVAFELVGIAPRRQGFASPRKARALDRSGPILSG
jgi:hypothetical protein